MRGRRGDVRVGGVPVRAVYAGSVFGPRPPPPRPVGGTRTPRGRARAATGARSAHAPAADGGAVRGGEGRRGTGPEMNAVPARSSAAPPRAPVEHDRPGDADDAAGPTTPAAPRPARLPRGRGTGRRTEGGVPAGEYAGGSPGAGGDRGPGARRARRALPRLAGRSAGDRCGVGAPALGAGLRPGSGFRVVARLRADDVLLAGMSERARRTWTCRSRPALFVAAPRRPRRRGRLTAAGARFGDRPDAVDPGADERRCGWAGSTRPRAVRHRRSGSPPVGPSTDARGRGRHQRRRAELPVGAGARGGCAAVDPGERPRGLGGHGREADRIAGRRRRRAGSPVGRTLGRRRARGARRGPAGVAAGRDRRAAIGRVRTDADAADGGGLGLGAVREDRPRLFPRSSPRRVRRAPVVARRRRAAGCGSGSPSGTPSPASPAGPRGMLLHRVVAGGGGPRPAGLADALAPGAGAGPRSPPDGVGRRSAAEARRRRTVAVPPRRPA